MSAITAGLIQLGVLLLLLAAVYVPFGNYLAGVYTSERHWRVERALYRLVRVDPDSEQRWTGYAAALLAFSFLSVVLLYLLQRLQGLLPLSLGRGAVEPGIAFNTAVSFVTNTNWQSYVPETVMGHLVQMTGLTVQNFVSGAVGMAVAVALVRGFARASTESRLDPASRSSARIGNFWVDLTRGVTRVLLPVLFVAAIVLVALGVTMSLRAGLDVTGVDGRSSTIALAPAAAQEAIKELGTNGGGIFNANSAHPFENPTALTNLLEIFLLLVIPVCLTRAFGVMVRDVRQGHVLLAVMTVLWGGLLAVAWWAETHPNGPAALAAGSALEGKEVRFGIPASVLFAVSTTGTSTGAVNSLHDSYTGLGGGVTLLNMLLGEVAPGGVGAGLYGILVLAVIAVFLAGLMVGRTPEYLGKKLGRVQVTAAAIAILAMPTVVLIGAGAALAQPGELDAALANSGAHGLSEVLYAYASAGNNNGSAFAGLTVTSPFFQTTLGLAMLFGRFVPILAVLALAGSLAAQRRVEPGAGTLPTHGALFGVLVWGTVVLVAALTFFPALALGPIAEALA
jgi:K+-transporting ATPase ATPase A chain